MALFDDLKKRADVNGDGKITKDDLTALNTPENKSKIDELRKSADRNGDGKLNMSDVKNIDFKQAAQDIKNVFKK
jgi:Ca2+-binding EF-hand superfamily protein